MGQSNPCSATSATEMGILGMSRNALVLQIYFYCWLWPLIRINTENSYSVLNTLTKCFRCIAFASCVEIRTVFVGFLWIGIILVDKTRNYLC